MRIFRQKEQKSLFWSLLEQRVQKPTPAWSIWSECQLEIVRINRTKEKGYPASALKAAPDASSTYHRMLDHAEKLKDLSNDSVAEFKAQYNDYGEKV